MSYLHRQKTILATCFFVFLSLFFLEVSFSGKPLLKTNPQKPAKKTRSLVSCRSALIKEILASRDSFQLVHRLDRNDLILIQDRFKQFPIPHTVRMSTPSGGSSLRTKFIGFGDRASHQASQGWISRAIPPFYLGMDEPHRYFQFVPKDHPHLVNARVLDVQSESIDDSLVLIEWIEEGGPQPIRHIGYLQQSEWSSVQIPLDPTVLPDFFMNLLSPNERYSLELARARGLQAVSFRDFYDDSLSEGANITHLAPRGWIEEEFGSIEDLLTEEEKGAYLWNVFDAMARMNPRYILNRFGHPSRPWEYVFVVTEDGQLRVAPFGHIGNNLKPQTIRLAAHRRVFATGTFHIDSKGTLLVSLGVETCPIGFSQDIYEYLNEVFWAQAGRHLFDFKEPTRPHCEEKKTNDNVPIEWTNEPLNYDPWLKGNGLLRTEENQLRWAHYVLGTSGDMSGLMIRQKFRQLMLKFHPDKVPEGIKKLLPEAEAKANRATQILTAAFALVDSK